jgi:hypothetical protein
MAALRRIFQRDEALFARAVARVFNVMVPAPVDVSVLGPTSRRPSRWSGDLRAEGLGAAILKVLDRRGIEVDDASRARIMSCGDGDVLDVWLDRSFVVASASELFA